MMMMVARTVTWKSRWFICGAAALKPLIGAIIANMFARIHMWRKAIQPVELVKASWDFLLDGCQWDLWNLWFRKMSEESLWMLRQSPRRSRNSLRSKVRWQGIPYTRSFPEQRNFLYPKGRFGNPKKIDQLTINKSHFINFNK